MSNNWIVENIQNALGTWNDKLNEIRRLDGVAGIVQGRGGAECDGEYQRDAQSSRVCASGSVLPDGDHEALQFLSEVKRPEQAIKLFLRFVLAKAAITWGLDAMMAIFRIAGG